MSNYSISAHRYVGKHLCLVGVVSGLSYDDVCLIEDEQEAKFPAIMINREWAGKITHNLVKELTKQALGRAKDECILLTLDYESQDQPLELKLHSEALDIGLIISGGVVQSVTSSQTHINIGIYVEDQDEGTAELPNHVKAITWR